MHDIIDGLEIILDNEPDADDFVAEHDQIFAGSRADTYPEDDKIQLEQLGWFITDWNSWSKHV